MRLEILHNIEELIVDFGAVAKLELHKVEVLEGVRLLELLLDFRAPGACVCQCVSSDC